MKPHRCPICEGKGEVEKGFYPDFNETDCRACRGAGVLWASEAPSIVINPPMTQPVFIPTVAPAPTFVPWQTQIWCRTGRFQ